MIYNIICEDIENKSMELWNTLNTRVINEGDGTYYKNSYYLAFINNSPVAVYINNKRIIHVVKLVQGKIQQEYILNASKGFKHFDSIITTAKKSIDLAMNKNDFIDKNFQELKII